MANKEKKRDLIANFGSSTDYAKIKTATEYAKIKEESKNIRR